MNLKLYCFILSYILSLDNFFLASFFTRGSLFRLCLQAFASGSLKLDIALVDLVSRCLDASMEALGVAVESEETVCTAVFHAALGSKVGPTAVQTVRCPNRSVSGIV